MISNETPKITRDPGNLFTQVWIFLTYPHPSIQDIEERSRAQLLAILTLLLTVMYAAALISRPASYQDFISLLLVTGIAYALSRTPYCRIGTYFFCFGFTAFAYVTLFLGTASSFSSAMTTTVHVSLVAASILLSVNGLALLVLCMAIASAMAPLYSRIPIAINSDF